jgi:hypothetical protein
MENNSTPFGTWESQTHTTHLVPLSAHVVASISRVISSPRGSIMGIPGLALRARGLVHLLSVSF